MTDDTSSRHSPSATAASAANAATPATATDATLHATLRARFGFDTFRAGQLDIIHQLLAGNSALAIFPTGSGKSLCYQLSALHLDGLTIVVSPLIALMKDQIDFLVSRVLALTATVPPVGENLTLGGRRWEVVEILSAEKCVQVQPSKTG